MNWFRTLIAWRWLPFVGFTLASVTFVLFALLFAGVATSGSKNEHAPEKSAAGALRFDHLRRALPTREMPATPVSSIAHQVASAGAPDVRSFFPPAAMELPPPLEEEEPVREPQQPIAR